MRERETHEADLGDVLGYGTILEVDHGRGLVRVQSGDVESDWIRWSTGRAGATRIWSPPSVGEQVAVLSPSGDIAGAFALGGFHSDANPPAGNTARELVRFADGAELAYDSEGHKLDALLPAGATVTINAKGGITIDASDGGISINGDVSIDGDLAVTGKVTADDVKAGAISLKTHKHTGVQAGSSQTGAPL